MLSVRNCTIHGGDNCLLQNQCFDVAPGEILTLMGASGTGKSTLLGWMIGELPPDFFGSGSLWLNGTRRDGLPTEKRRIGILFQDDLLFPHLSVGQNLALALPAQLKGKRSRREYIENCLIDAELGEFYQRDPATLSGGQRARVSVLRSLIAEPEALLLDEPFSRLDEHLRGRFRQFVFSHIQQRGIPALLVTHDEQDIPPDGRVKNLEERADV
ncbi:ATP-binding cassette domain-containing protein [Salmonella enterica subsp. enterica serovar Haifa]|nr:ATP-binding cassette domain-containing protein [Salmonella enterica subsp. enterica serovar Haifa]